MPDLTSRHLKSCDYNLNTQELSIEFRDGKKYRYEDVPRETFDGLLAAPSAGQYFRQHLRHLPGKKS